MISLYRKYSGSFPAHITNNISGLILQIQRYIEENSSHNINLKDISKMYYTDMYYLSHNFKKITGYTFKEYLILQRISRAKDFLYHTKDDISMVGVKSGFNNVNHFIRIFKKITGITPLQYRKKQLFSS
jgi:YesN/AraC family two-component response regulator